MAAADTELAIVLRVIADDLKAGLASAAGAVKAWGAEVAETIDVVEERAEGLKNVWKDLFEAFVAVEVVEGLKKIAEAASEAADRMEIAANTARNFGHEAEAATQDDWLQKFAASARGGGFAIDEMRASLQQFASVGANSAQQERLLADAVGLAAMKHLDLAEATRILTLAASGHVALLSRYGIETKDATGKTIDFETAIARLERAMSGDAEIRANGLEGAFTRLGNALGRIVDGAFGQELEAIFAGIANALTRFLDLVNRIPAPILEAIAIFAAFSLGMTALTLTMGALPLVGRILIATFENVGTVLNVLGRGFGLVGAAAAKIGEAVGFAARGFEFLGAMIGVDILPIIGIAAAIGVVSVVIYELIQHLDQLGRAWQTVTEFMSRAWGEFVQNVLSSRTALLTFFKDVADAIANPALGGAELGSFAVEYIPKTTMAVFQGVKGGIDSGIAYAKKEWGEFAKFVQGIFAPTIGPDAGGANANLAGLGGQEKQQGADPQKALDDVLTQEKAKIQAPLDAAAQSVERAKDALEEASVAAARFKDALPDGKPQTLAQARQEQTLITAEITKARDVQAELVRQKAALLAAARAEDDLAKKLPAYDKDRVTHAAELTKAATEHRLEAEKTQLAFDQMAASAERFVRTLSGPMKEFLEQMKTVSDAMVKSADAAADAAAKIAEAQIQGQEEAARIARAEAQRAGRSSGRGGSAAGDPQVQEAQQQVQSTGFEAALAQIADQLAQEKVANAESATVIDFAKLNDAIEAEAEAHAKLEVALNNARLAQQAYNDAIAKSQLTFKNVLDQAASVFAKLIPGLQVTENANGSLSALFNWTALLGDAIAKTKDYKAIQSVVNQVVQVFAQILNALLPVIELLLRVFATFANIIIDVYNVFARLLGLLGIHVQLLNQINTQFKNLGDNVQPLITITHDLPTQNELASGNIAQLTDDPNDVSNSFLSPVTNALQSSTLGGGLLGAILEVVAGVAALKEIMAAFGVGSGLNSGGGGILGFFKNLFNFGGGSSNIPTFSGDSYDVGAGGLDLSQSVTQLPETTGIVDTSDGLVGALAGPNAIADLDTTDGVAGLMVGQSTAADVADTPATVAMATSSGASALSATSVLGALGGAFGGIGIGAGISKLLGLGGDSSAGGMAGGAIGGLLTSTLFGAAGTTGGVLAGLQLGAFAGPVGMIGGALLGTLIGSLFGNRTSPGQNPDLYEGQTGYGQKNADLEDGPAGANGQSFTPDQLTQAFVEAMGIRAGTINGAAGAGSQMVNSNGTIASSGGVDAVETWLSQYSATNLPPGVTAQQYAAWVAQFGTSGTGQVTHPDSNIGDIAITGSGGGSSGVQSYADLAASLAQIEELWAQGAQSLAGTFSDLAKAATPVTSGLANLGNQLAAAVRSPASTAPGAAGATTVTVTMGDTNINGGVSGVDDLESLSEAQADALIYTLRSRGYLINKAS